MWLNYLIRRWVWMSCEFKQPLLHKPGVELYQCQQKHCQFGPQQLRLLGWTRGNRTMEWQRYSVANMLYPSRRERMSWRQFRDLQSYHSHHRPRGLDGPLLCFREPGSPCRKSQQQGHTAEPKGPGSHQSLPSGPRSQSIKAKKILLQP